MIELEPVLALLQQRTREPRELVDLLVQFAIVLLFILLPVGRAVFESIKKRQAGGQAPPTPPPVPGRPEGLGRGRSGRPEGIDAFEQLLRKGRTDAAHEARAEPEPGPTEAPFGTWGPAETREEPPGRVPNDRERSEAREAALAAQRRELAARRAREARERAERERRREERARELEREERERESARGAFAAGGEGLAGLEIAVLSSPGAARQRRPVFLRERTRNAWREAVVLSEILGPPLALRDPRRGPGSPTPRGD